MTISIYDMTDEQISNLTQAQLAEAMQAESDTNDDGNEDTGNDDAGDADDNAANNSSTGLEVADPAGDENAADKADEEEDGEEDDGQSDEDFLKTKDQAPGSAGKTADAAPSPEGGAQDKTQEGSDTPPAKTEDKVVEAGVVLTPEEAQSAVSKILAPFKASGRQIQVKSVDDAMALMRMGANYSDKMNSLKPHLAMVKLLEKNGLLDTDKLNYLIDIHQKNPQAINKLIKDSGIDPMDIDSEKTNDYAPTERRVTAQEVELDSVLNDLGKSEHYGKLVTTVGDQWDQSSRDVIGQNPGMLKLLHDHIERGYFDKITEEIANERMLGRLEGLSDIQAYRQVGDRLHSEGKFNDNSQPAPEIVKTAPVREVLKPNPGKTDAVANARKKAVSSTRSSAGKTAKPLINPLELSDEEFSKIGGINYLKN